MKQTLFLLWFIPVLLGAQNKYAASAIAPALLENANLVVRTYETEFAVLSNGDTEMEMTFAATILKEEGLDAGQLLAQEDRFSKVKSMKGKLFDAEGKLIRSTKDEEIKEYGSSTEYEFTDDKVKVLTLRYPSYPFTVEFKEKIVTKGSKGILPCTIQALGQSVEHWSYQLEIPSKIHLKWKVSGLNLNPVQTEHGDKTTWLWEANQLAAKPVEPYNPFFQNINAQIILAPAEVNFDGHPGNFDSWNNIGRFFYELNDGRTALSPETVARVKEMTDGKTNKEKIAVLYRFMQDNCRYVSIQLGIGGWQAFEAKFVDEKKYGDCKALSNYMQALLNAVGIDAWKVCIYAGDDWPEHHENLPYPYFNHMILYVPSEDCWLECTSKTFPAGYLGAFTANREALLLTPDGGKLVRTPPLRPSDNYEKTNARVVLQEDGNARVECSARYGGDRHEYYRYLALESTQKDLEEYFVKNADYSIGKLLKINTVADRNRPEATIDFQAELPKYATLSGKRMFVPLTKVSTIKRSLPANEKRALDLKATYCYVLTDTFSVQFPATFEPENTPAEKKIETEFGSYQMHIEKQADRVLAIRRVEVRPVAVPAARYAEVRQFFLDAAKADATQMVLVKKQ